MNKVSKFLGKTLLVVKNSGFYGKPKFIEGSENFRKNKKRVKKFAVLVSTLMI